MQRNVRVVYDTEAETASLRDSYGNSYDLPGGVKGDKGDTGATGATGPAGAGRATPGTPVNAVAATKAMTIDGVAVHGEKVEIGDDVYQFAADVAQTVDEGSIAVDITSYVTASSNTLTVDTIPTAGDTFEIVGKTYTIVPNGTANAEGEVNRGSSKATAQANIKAAINGTDGHNTANEYVSCGDFSNDVATITAKIGGVAGDAITTTETFTAETNVFSAGTLGSGADCAKGNARTALVAAITAHDTQGVGAAPGAGDLMNMTADVKGAAGNAITLATTMVHGSFAGGATSLSGGVDGTVGTAGDLKIDASYLYACSADNTVADTNWRRISIGSAY